MKQFYIEVKVMGEWDLFETAEEANVNRKVEELKAKGLEVQIREVEDND